MYNNNRGAALGIVIVTALICGIAAYAVLFTAVSEARLGRFARERSQARYLAEAGLTIALQQLWLNPAYCGGTELVDTNGDGVGDAPVNVTVTSCGAGNAHELRATVTY